MPVCNAYPTGTSDGFFKRNSDGSRPREYHQTWHIRTNNWLDNENTIYKWFKAERGKDLPKDNGKIPWIGDRLELGNDHDNWVVCTEIKPSRQDNDPTTWSVVVTFRTLENEDYQHLNSHDQIDDDPIYERCHWSTSFQPVMEDVDVSEFLGYTDGPSTAYQSTYLHSPGDEIMPVNSAGERIDPLPQREFAIAVLRCQFNNTQVVGLDIQPLLYTVNSTQVVINYDDFTYTLEPLTLQVRSVVTSAAKWKNDVIYYEITIQYHWDKRTYVKRYANVGKSAIQTPGISPDGHGGIVPALPAGSAALRRIVDMHGNPIGFHWLDRDGNPATSNGGLAPFMNYLLHKKLDFNTEDFLKRCFEEEAPKPKKADQPRDPDDP